MQNITIFFSNDANELKVTVKTFVMFQKISISNRCCSWFKASFATICNIDDN